MPPAFIQAVDRRLALDLYTAAVALMARLSAGEPAGCVGEDIVAVTLLDEARSWLETRAEGGKISEGRRKESGRRAPRDFRAVPRRRRARSLRDGGASRRRRRRTQLAKPAAWSGGPAHDRVVSTLWRCSPDRVSRRPRRGRLASSSFCRTPRATTHATTNRGGPIEIPRPMRHRARPLHREIVSRSLAHVLELVDDFDRPAGKRPLAFEREAGVETERRRQLRPAT